MKKSHIQFTVWRNILLEIGNSCLQVSFNISVYRQRQGCGFYRGKSLLSGRTVNAILFSVTGPIQQGLYVRNPLAQCSQVDMIQQEIIGNLQEHVINNSWTSCKVVAIISFSSNTFYFQSSHFHFSQRILQTTLKPFSRENTTFTLFIRSWKRVFTCLGCASNKHAIS